MDLNYINNEIQEIKIKIRTQENLIQQKIKILKSFDITSLKEAKEIMKKINIQIEDLKNKQKMYEKKAEIFLELIK
jgi:predicted nucleotidyltransferase